MKQYKCLRCGAIIETNDCLRLTVCTAPAEYRTSGICGNGCFEELPFQPDQVEQPDYDTEAIAKEYYSAGLKAADITRNEWFTEELERRMSYIISNVSDVFIRNILAGVKSELLKPLSNV